MPLIRTELAAESRDHARGVLRRYRSGERDPHLEDQVVAELSLRGLTPRGRPHLAGLTNANPPLLLFDTDVHPETGS